MSLDKPKLRRAPSGGWMCVGRGGFRDKVLGWGSTPESAYKNWHCFARQVTRMKAQDMAIQRWHGVKQV